MPKRFGAPGNSFLARKRFWLAALRSSLKERDPAFALHPHVRGVVVELNKLPFVYTDDSAGPQLFLSHEKKIEEVRRQAETIKRARKAGKAIFRRAFVTLWLKEGHPGSRRFYLALQEWQRRHYPAARVADMPPMVSVLSPLESSFVMSARIPSGQIDSRMAESKKFMSDLHAFVRKYAAERRKKKN